MQIIHQIDDFSFTICREFVKVHSLIVPTLENYYTYLPFKPKITIDDEGVDELGLNYKSEFETAKVMVGR